MANATNLEFLDRRPVQTTEEAHILNLNRGQKTIAAPAVGAGDSFPDQAFADLVVTSEVAVNP